MKTQHITRRKALRMMGSGLAAFSLTPLAASARNEKINTKSIPGTGESIPVIGMGTWQTFNVGSDSAARENLTRVMRVFFEKGGGMIDSSPMYGSAQEVIGTILGRIGIPDSLFSADKVWTRHGDRTREQVREIEALWGIDRFDLMQVHNLVAWEEHLETLQRMKEEGRIRYVGITTSHGRRHEETEHVMNLGGIDFVQLTYNLTHRQVEQRLLPLAAERGIAVIANRPYDGGSLVKGLQRGNHPLPGWAGEFDIHNWPDFLLKFIVSHPAVTCAIPATSKVEHMRENMEAGRGRLPDSSSRAKMIEYVQSL